MLYKCTKDYSERHRSFLKDRIYNFDVFDTNDQIIGGSGKRISQVKLYYSNGWLKIHKIDFLECFINVSKLRNKLIDDIISKS